MRYEFFDQNERTELTKAKRKCVNCKEEIPKGHICLARNIDNFFGASAKSLCKTCAITFVDSQLAKYKKHKIELSTNPK